MRRPGLGELGEDALRGRVGGGEHDSPGRRRLGKVGQVQEREVPGGHPASWTRAAPRAAHTRGGGGGRRRRVGGRGGGRRSQVGPGPFGGASGEVEAPQANGEPPADQGIQPDLALAAATTADALTPRFFLNALTPRFFINSLVHGGQHGRPPRAQEEVDELRRREHSEPRRILHPQAGAQVDSQVGS